MNLTKENRTEEKKFVTEDGTLWTFWVDKDDSKTYYKCSKDGGTN
jgi:hypothetical protein